ncbi:hypothetical protein CYMTET_32041 [Cymbomonas tetramitiformis]|uniref:Uncharacterized protein n=1 Tax=Cymbomonas tetramitiformis TaxID=36881 RepID=A0AAE0FGK2_9CHLO|nr:hypothetical protein CYMTET_32041 [Cymbomonas tetramitiformis]
MYSGRNQELNVERLPAWRDQFRHQMDKPPPPIRRRHRRLNNLSTFPPQIRHDHRRHRQSGAHSDDEILTTPARGEWALARQRRGAALTRRRKQYHRTRGVRGGDLARERLYDSYSDGYDSYDLYNHDHGCISDSDAGPYQVRHGVRAGAGQRRRHQPVLAEVALRQLYVRQPWVQQALRGVAPASAQVPLVDGMRDDWSILEGASGNFRGSPIGRALARPHTHAGAAASLPAGRHPGLTTPVQLGQSQPVEEGGEGTVSVRRKDIEHPGQAAGRSATGVSTGATAGAQHWEAELGTRAEVVGEQVDAFQRVSRWLEGPGETAAVQWFVGRGDVSCRELASLIGHELVDASVPEMRYLHAVLEVSAGVSSGGAALSHNEMKHACHVGAAAERLLLTPEGVGQVMQVMDEVEYLVEVDYAHMAGIFAGFQRDECQGMTGGQATEWGRLDLPRLGRFLTQILPEARPINLVLLLAAAHLHAVALAREAGGPPTVSLEELLDVEATLARATTSRELAYPGELRCGRGASGALAWLTPGSAAEQLEMYYRWTHIERSQLLSYWSSAEMKKREAEASKKASAAADKRVAKDKGMMRGAVWLFGGESGERCQELAERKIELAKAQFEREYNTYADLIERVKAPGKYTVTVAPPITDAAKAAQANNTLDKALGDYVTKLNQYSKAVKNQPASGLAEVNRIGSSSYQGQNIFHQQYLTAADAVLQHPECPAPREEQVHYPDPISFFQQCTEAFTYSVGPKVVQKVILDNGMAPCIDQRKGEVSL